MADIVFRCEMSPAAGLGHVMRCLAAAEELAWAGWETVFARTPGAEALPALQQAGHALGDWPALAGDWAVFDHYGLGAEAERGARERFGSIAAFEDKPNRMHDADLLVDPTPDRRAEAYASFLPARARFLLGLRAAQIHRRWRAARAAAPATRAGDVRRIVVSMGATDPGNATARVLSALREACPGMAVDVALAGTAPHLNALQADLRTNETLYVDTPDLPGLMAQADLAIGGAGSSCFERALLGLPSVIVQLADNQSDLVRAFERAGAAVAVPAGGLNDASFLAKAIKAVVDDEGGRSAMSRAGRALVDGRGAQRLLLALSAVPGIGLAGLSVRLAEAEDSDWLLELQRKPQTRRHSLNPKAPENEEHHAWMAVTIDATDRLLCILEYRGVAAGMLRLDKIGEEFSVSIAVDPLFQHRGIGSGALKFARRMVRGHDLAATVKPENAASRALFLGAGYVQTSANTYRNKP